MENLLESIDDIKEKLTSQEYKTIMDNLMKFYNMKDMNKKIADDIFEDFVNLERSIKTFLCSGEIQENNDSYDHFTEILIDGNLHEIMNNNNELFQYMLKNNYELITSMLTQEEYEKLIY